MTSLQEKIYNVIPSNILQKESMTGILDLFFKVVDSTCNVNNLGLDYFSMSTDVLVDDLMKIYLQNIYEVLDDIKDDVIEVRADTIPPQNRMNYCYSDLNLGLDYKLRRFSNNGSTGLESVFLDERIIVTEYNNGSTIEGNKVFKVKDLTGLGPLSTIDDAILNNNIFPEITCCSNIPCILPSTATTSCSIGSDISTYIRNYTGTNLAIDILNQLTDPGALTDCYSKANPEDNASELPYRIGSNWAYTNFYISRDYIDEHLNLNNIINLQDVVNDEHIWSAKNFKQEKGHAVSFYFTYNIIKNIHIDTGLQTYGFEYINLTEDKDENGNLIPFSYTVKSLIHEYIYNNTIHPVAHPVGFDSKYKRELAFSINDYFCKNKLPDFDVFFIYSVKENAYFDIRTGDGLFGSTGIGRDLRYSVEIADYYFFEEYDYTYISITMTNGYKYVKEFNGDIKLYNDSGITVKSFDTSSGIVPINTKIYFSTKNDYIKTIDNDRDFNSSVDLTTGNDSDKVYRIEFDKTNGSFLSNIETTVFLVDSAGSSTVEYHIVDGRINLYNSDGSLKYSFNEYYSMVYGGLEFKYDILCKEDIKTLITQDLRNENCIPHYMIIQEPIDDVNYAEQKSYDLDLNLSQTDTDLPQISEVKFDNHPKFTGAGTVYSFSINGNIISYTSIESEPFRNVIRNLYSAFLLSPLYGIIECEMDLNNYKLIFTSDKGLSNKFDIIVDGSNTSIYTIINNIMLAQDSVDINKYIKDYISMYGDDYNLSKYILNHLSPPDPAINVTDESLQGIDKNYNKVNDFLEYGYNGVMRYQDWGWTVGADRSNNLPSNYNITNMNDFISSYTGNTLSRDIQSFIRGTYYRLDHVAPVIGYFNHCGDELTTIDTIDTIYYSEFFDTTTPESGYFDVNNIVDPTGVGVAYDRNIVFKYSFNLDEIIYIVDSDLTSVLKVNWEIDPIDYITDNGLEPTAVDGCTLGSDVDLNVYINDYIIANGNSNYIAWDIANNSTYPGFVTNCKNVSTAVHTRVGFVLDIATPGGFFVGEQGNAEEMAFADNLVFL